MKKIKLKIQLDTPIPQCTTYSSGQEICGRVILEVEEDTSTAFNLELIWMGRTEIKSSSYYYSKWHLDERRIKTYVAKKMVLIGSKTASGEKVIPPGHYSYPFRYRLPKGIPSSFEASFTSKEFVSTMYAIEAFVQGRVHYYVQASFKGLNWSPKSPPDAKMEFLVRKEVDVNLNLNPDLDYNHKPTFFKAERKLWGLCLWFNSAIVRVSFLTERSFFIPEESIQFSAVLTNKSCWRVTGSVVRLVQVSVFQFKEGFMTNSRTIVEKKGPGVGPGGKVVWIEKDFIIPPMTQPTDLRGLIKIRYELEMTLKIPLRSNISKSAPISIGTIPLRSGSGDGADRLVID